MTPEGIKTARSDQQVDETYVSDHLHIGIDSLKELIKQGTFGKASPVLTPCPPFALSRPDNMKITFLGAAGEVTARLICSNPTRPAS